MLKKEIYDEEQLSCKNDEKPYKKKKISDKRSSINLLRKNNSLKESNNSIVNLSKPRNTVFNDPYILRQRLSVITEEIWEEKKQYSSPVSDYVAVTFGKNTYEQTNENKFTNQNDKNIDIFNLEGNTSIENYDIEPTGPESVPDDIRKKLINQKQIQLKIIEDQIINEKYIIQKEEINETSFYSVKEKEIHKNNENREDVHFDLRLNRSQIIKNNLNESNLSKVSYDRDSLDSNIKFGKSFEIQMKKEFHHKKKINKIKQTSKICTDVKRILELESSI